MRRTCRTLPVDPGPLRGWRGRSRCPSSPALGLGGDLLRPAVAAAVRVDRHDLRRPRRPPGRARSWSARETSRSRRSGRARLTRPGGVPEPARLVFAEPALDAARSAREGGLELGLVSDSRPPCFGAHRVPRPACPFVLDTGAARRPAACRPAAPQHFEERLAERSQRERARAPLGGRAEALAQVGALDQLAHALGQLGRRRRPGSRSRRRRSTPPARPPPARRWACRHSAASITVSDQPSDWEAVKLTHARPYSSAFVSSST